MNKNKLHDHLAKEIATEISESNTYDLEGIKLKVKAILSTMLDFTRSEKEITEIRVRISRQSLALRKLDEECKFWKQKVINKEKYYKELNQMLTKIK